MRRWRWVAIAQTVSLVAACIFFVTNLISGEMSRFVVGIAFGWGVAAAFGIGMAYANVMWQRYYDAVQTCWDKELKDLHGNDR